MASRTIERLLAPKYEGLGKTYEAVADITEQDVTDQKRAERAKRIMESEVWQKDFFPMLTELHDKYLQQVKSKQIDPDALKVIDDIVTQIDGAVQLGAQALQRMAKRRLQQTQNLK